jgi:CheY-like chemotaxis protein
MNLPLSLAHKLTAAGRLAPGAAPVSTPSTAGLAVLVVDDEAECRAELAETLERRGLLVLAANSAEAALFVLRSRPEVAALITDIRMPGMDGFALAEAAMAGRSPAAALEVVLVTGYVGPGHALAAARIGACSLMPKPVRGAEIARIVEDALDRAAARRRAAAAGLAAPVAFAAPERSTAGAATALLAALAQRADTGGQGLARIARSLRAPLSALLAEDAASRDAGEARRAMALMDELLEAVALEEGTLPTQPAPVSAHGLASGLIGRLGALGVACGRRIILQPDADPAFRVDMARLARAVGLLAAAALRAGGAGRPVGELSLDAGAGEARLELTIRLAEPPALPAEARPEATLPIAIARRLVAAQGGRLEAWLLPEGVLRARLHLPAA